MFRSFRLWSSDVFWCFFTQKRPLFTKATHVPAISDAKLQANGFVPQELVAVCEVIPVSESDHAHPLGPGGLPYRQL